MGIINTKKRKQNRNNGIINNFINTDTNLSSYTSDDFLDFYDAINEMDFGDNSSSNGSLSNGVTDFDNFSLNISYVVDENNNNNYYYNNNIINNRKSTKNFNINNNTNEWKCSSIFVTYNIRIKKYECAKSIGEEVKRRISIFKKSSLIEPLDISQFEFNMNSNDLFSNLLSKEIQSLILSNLSIYDLLTLFRVNKYWYEFGQNNSFWKMLTLRDCEKWNNKDLVKLKVKNCQPFFGDNKENNNSSWKDFYKNMTRLKVCKQCKLIYREYSNSNNACNYHSDIRDLIHCRGALPSGMYWSCCLSKPKNSIGCTTKCHEEE
ncbi:hypothetical protein RB653_002628 [Dictyostelium firmibasis]|uniref:F-box domain-containing protein n=1 Tax=Dictyostelium firmibasis TaxID=79012 RepID=A0AAN7U9P9_9MYCE